MGEIKNKAKVAMEKQAAVFRYAPWCAETRWALMHVQDIREIWQMARDHAEEDGGVAEDWLFLHVPEYAVEAAAEQAIEICDELLKRWKGRKSQPFVDAYLRATKALAEI